MAKKGLILAGGILALLFVPGTIPAFIATKTAKFTKKRHSSSISEG